MENQIKTKNGRATTLAADQFESDVVNGLLTQPKRLASKYFYDERGDALFQQIMGLDEYYLTRCEYEILESHKRQLLSYFEGAGRQKFELIEFGAGDGYKTKVLLSYFLEKGADFKYLPIDISANVLNQLVSDLKSAFPRISTEGLQGDYFEALGRLNRMNGHIRKALLFLGSNIGNFAEQSAIAFLTKLRSLLSSGDMILIGFDLVKDPDIILNAYNDASGITRAFNLNLLNRINRELDGNFDIAAFKHYATYNPQSSEARSYLVSRIKQTVTLQKPGVEIEFAQWEPVFMEISQKYTVSQIARLAASAGFEVSEYFFDKKKYFVDALWKAV